MTDALEHNLKIFMRDSDNYFATGEMHDECSSEKAEILETIKMILDIGDIQLDELDDLINTDSDIYIRIQRKNASTHIGYDIGREDDTEPYCIDCAEEIMGINETSPLTTEDQIEQFILEGNTVRKITSSEERAEEAKCMMCTESLK